MVNLAAKVVAVDLSGVLLQAPISTKGRCPSGKLILTYG